MKHWFTLLTAFLFLLGKTELHEFCKMPTLVEHYQQHKINNPGLSFLDYLFLHYGGVHPDDNDNDDDNQLPFKSVTDIVHVNLPVITYQENIFAGYPAPAQFQNAYHNEGFLTKAGNSIFHPPRNY